MSKVTPSFETSTAPATGVDQLLTARGIVVQQRAKSLEVIAQAFGVPYEARNKYILSLLPDGKQVKSEPDDANGWEPSQEELRALVPFMFAQEESSCLIRCLCTCLGARQLRPLKLHFAVNGTTGDVYLVDKHVRCGGGCCCPMQMDLYQAVDQTRPIGRVRENYSPYLSKCCAVCCTATVYHDIERTVTSTEGSREFEKRYELRANVSCCGRVNNCCGATCCKNDMVFDILDTNGNVVAHLQKTYGRGGGCGACCRMLYQYDNFILEFPSDSTLEDRMLLLTSIFQLEFQVFEKQKNNE